MEEREALNSLSLSNKNTSGTSSPLKTLTEANSLKIISWNIFMLPRFIMRTGQLQRAREIVNVLKEEDADIIVFQEAFDSLSREIIRKGLLPYFPYESGDPPKNIFWKTNSGLWVISKIPFLVVRHLYFIHGKGPDWFATKGAILIQAEKNSQGFQVIGTHLQSDFGGRQAQKIRQLQYEQIRQELIEPYEKENVPQFLVGDFNTMHHEPAHYEQMLNTLKVKQCALEGEHVYSYDHKKNDLIKGAGSPPQLIDYILYNHNALCKLDAKMFINVFRKQWHAKFTDLSDHFAVSGIFQFL
jgi:endonuclease/exonuclease/phosphatase family metal-dependent hydrolase